MRKFCLTIAFSLFYSFGFAQKIISQVEICPNGALSKRDSLKKLSIVIKGDTLDYTHAEQNIFTFSSIPIDTSLLYSRSQNLKKGYNYSDYIDTVFVANNRESVILIYETIKYLYTIPVEKWEVLCGLQLCINKIYKKTGYYRYNKSNCSVIQEVGILKRIKKNKN